MSADDLSLSSAAQYGFVSVAFMLGARALYNFYNAATDSPEPCEYIHWSDDLPEDLTVIVDATHHSLPTLSHHKGARNPAGLKPADTSTGIVLNALQPRAQWHRDIAAVTRRRYVTTNHFDIDSFLSVWCYLNRKVALEHEGGGLAACRTATLALAGQPSAEAGQRRSRQLQVPAPVLFRLHASKGATCSAASAGATMCRRAWFHHQQQRP